MIKKQTTQEINEYISKLDFNEKALIYEVIMPRINKKTYIRISIRTKNPIPKHNYAQIPFYDILDIIKEIDEEVTSEEILNANPLTYSFATMLFPLKITGKYKYKFMFEDNLLVNEKYYPEERSCNYHVHYPNYIPENQDWFHKVNAELNKYKDGSLYTPYQYIKHLAPQGINNDQELLTHAITIIWIKRLNLNFWDYYNEEETIINFWLKIKFLQSKETIFYNKVPKQYWNKIWYDSKL